MSVLVASASVVCIRLRIRTCMRIKAKKPIYDTAIYVGAQYTALNLCLSIRRVLQASASRENQHNRTRETAHAFGLKKNSSITGKLMLPLEFQSLHASQKAVVPARKHHYPRITHSAG